MDSHAAAGVERREKLSGVTCEALEAQEEALWSPCLKGEACPFIKKEGEEGTGSPSIKEEEQEVGISQEADAGKHTVAAVKSEDGNRGGKEKPTAPFAETSSPSRRSPDEDRPRGGPRSSKAFRCPQCAKTFGSKSNLKRHMGCHTGEKLFGCSACGKRFSQKGILMRHARTHTGEKPFSCPFCAKGFSLKGNLLTHTRIHTGEKPFSCSACGASFTVGSALVQHARTHSGERPFACSFCSKSFSQKVTLMTHLRRHTGEKVFRCHACDRAFAYKYQLGRHPCGGGKSADIPTLNRS
ncbi:gastrula zinc finger protein XlCGF7.1-like [Syngnathus acus]|uniref:gastrula zinc finger protein XlCGF7.1-like n=1 Tax=Syngnathus acus TaxID=161584 RepID=UPI00188632FA|nr:gastrula zinc finger protein XlCGF7.1-like [Syngnathus acus]